MSRRVNPFLILSSDPGENGDGDTSPPSDPPQPSSDTEFEPTSPVGRLPALATLLYPVKEGPSDFQPVTSQCRTSILQQYSRDDWPESSLKVLSGLQKPVRNDFGRDPSTRLRTVTGSVSTGTPVTYLSVFCGRPHWPTDRRPVENGNGPSHLPRFHSSFGPSAGVWLATLCDHDHDHHHDHEHLTLTLTHARAPTSTSTPAGLAFCIAPITLNAQSIQLRLGSLGSLCISPRRTARRVAGGSHSVDSAKKTRQASSSWHQALSCPLSLGIFLWCVYLFAFPYNSGFGFMLARVLIQISKGAYTSELPKRLGRH
ncbi:hypothetical protein B0H13DRAFT_2529885 [Mycena leptocephala]|nr:hypothetical protein B0H13DRAFT_2529885 [Mycena leptocephala]